jgi:hypothetical protein
VLNLQVLLLPALDLAVVKAIKAADSARSCGRTTVNDVLTALLAGALRQYCQAQGDPLLPAGDCEGDDSPAVQVDTSRTAKTRPPLCRR